MIGRVLFLSFVAYASYWYIRRSNRRAQQISSRRGAVEILPPEPEDISSARPLEPGAEAEPIRQLPSPAAASRASEPEPGR
jgi:hypothetical protein